MQFGGVNMWAWNNGTEGYSVTLRKRNDTWFGDWMLIAWEQNARFLSTMFGNNLSSLPPGSSQHHRPTSHCLRKIHKREWYGFPDHSRWSQPAECTGQKLFWISIFRKWRCTSGFFAESSVIFPMRKRLCVQTLNEESPWLHRFDYQRPLFGSFSIL